MTNAPEALNDLGALRAFVALARERHFGRAAASLHLTQPPFSRRIQSLEAALGVALFERTKRRVAATAAGVALLPEAQAILARVDALATLGRRAARGDSGQLSIAFVTTADYNVLPIALAELRRTAPNVTVTLREATSDEQLRELERGAIDLGILIPPVPERLQPLLDYRTLVREPLVLALPETHAAARTRGAVSLRRLERAPLVIFPRPLAPQLYDDILAVCRETGAVHAIAQEAVQMQTIISLVSAGIGIALVPASFRNLARRGVVYKSLVERTPLTELGIAWRRDAAQPALARFVAATLRAVRALGRPGAVREP
jgi:DNA-binding transcriptional LysR family regulator